VLSRTPYAIRRSSQPADSLEIKRRLGVKTLKKGMVRPRKTFWGKPGQALKDHKQALALWQGLDKAATGEILNDLAQLTRGLHTLGLGVSSLSVQV